MTEGKNRLAGAALLELEERRALIDFCAVLEEQAHGLGVILSRRPDECRFAVKFVVGCYVGAVLEQRPQGIGSASSRGCHEHRFAFGQCGVGIRPGFEQGIDHGGIARDGREVQRRHAVTIRDRGIRTRGE
jgi:hypothetical protein